MSAVKLSRDVLATLANGCGVCDAGVYRPFRVTVFTPGGVQISFCDLGEGDDKLTFP